MTASIMVGDCRERLKELPDASVDSVVCDPPYHLTSIVKRFGKVQSHLDVSATKDQSKIKAPQYGRLSKGLMGQTWDGGDVAFQPETWAEVLRVLKPGGHMVAFSGTRTYHRMVCAIEDAGFEIRDSIYWHYGSGFPKSLSVFKQLEQSGEACLCGKSKLSHHHATAENLHHLQHAVDAKNTLSVGPQSNVRPSVQGQADRHEASGAAAESSTDNAVRDVRKASPSPALASGKDASGVLQRVVSIQDVRGSAAAILGQHEGAKAGATVSGEESSLEGRRDAQEAKGELQGRQVCEGAGLGAADGAQGSLHHGASSSDGSNVRLPADTDGSSEPQGPQSGEQPPIELRALPNQRGSQTWGGWPVCGGCGKPIIPEGLGTALKPSTEPICLARKPLIGTVAGNALAHGTGALNIDGCRIEMAPGEEISPRGSMDAATDIHEGWSRPWMADEAKSVARMAAAKERAETLGRWPANLCHDGSDEVLAGFPDVSSHGDNGGSRSLERNEVFGQFTASDRVTRQDSGSAARFFYCAKATTEERGEGNNHPTVKPVALMQWLCRLITPKGGTVLDPFMGSGSTGLAADAEQFNFIGCEMSADYAAIARRRICDAAGMFADVRAA